MNNNIEIWEDVFKKNEWGKYPPIPVVRFIARNFYKSLNRNLIKILEIGSGTGANLWYCAKEGFSIYGIEGSSTAVKRMENRFKEDGISLNLDNIIIGDYNVKIDDFNDEYFDAIIDSESLYCNSYKNSKSTIRKCINKLKKNGVMLSVTFAEGSWGFKGEEEIEYHAVLPKDGPMGGKGFSRYSTKLDIETLYSSENSIIERIERQEYFYAEDNVVKEWIIELRKL